MSKFINSFIIFSIFYVLIYAFKPSIFFDNYENPRLITINSQHYNISILHLFIIFIAFISNMLASKLK